MAEVKKESVYFQHIMDAIDRIASHLGKLSFSDFMDTSVVQDAVVRQIEILGEAAKHVSESTRARYPDIPWKVMAGMRDKMIHDYFDVDLSLVWETATDDIPLLKSKIEKILEDVKGAS